MPKSLEFFMAMDVQIRLRAKGLPHLRVRARGKVLTVESGDEQEPIPHARLRRVTAQYWQLEMPAGSRRWEPTPVRGLLGEVLDTLVNDFGWTLAPIE